MIVNMHKLRFGMSFIAWSLCFVTIIHATIAYQRGIEDYICFGQPSGAIVPDPEHCGAYFSCDGGLGLRTFCHEGIYFNPILTQCDINYKDCTDNSWTTTHNSTTAPNTTEISDNNNSNNTNNNNNNNINIIDNNSNNNDTGNYNNTTTEQSIETNPDTLLTDEDLVDACSPEDTLELTYLASYERCDRFYLCYYGKPLPFDCSTGFLWSQMQQACVATEQSDCRVNII